MRGVAVLIASILLLVAAGPSSSAEDVPPKEPTPHLLVPLTNGTFLAGTFGAALPIDPFEDNDTAFSMDHRTWDAVTEDCHRKVFVSLDYHPTSATNDPDAPVDMPYIFDIGLTFNNTTSNKRVLEPVAHLFLGQLHSDGELSIHLRLRQGAMVEWSFTAYAHEAPDCDGPVPIGTYWNGDPTHRDRSILFGHDLPFPPNISG